MDGLAASGLSVVVPTLNEAEGIGALLEQLVQALAPLEEACEILVVDDDSQDGTASIAEGAAQRITFPVRVLARRVDRPSLASAVLYGTARANYPIVCVLDADGSHDPAVVPRLARAVLSGQTDVAIGSRYIRGGGISNWPWARLLASRAACLPARILTGVTDPMSGFFACGRDLLLERASHARGFKVLFELLVRSPKGLRVEEVPIQFCDRAQGKSKASATVALAYLAQLVKLGITPRFWRARLRPGGET